MTLQTAQRAGVLGHNIRFSGLHTLSSIQAELGNTTEAREVILHAMEVGGLEEPDSLCWYVFARIAEQYGELDAALC